MAIKFYLENRPDKKGDVAIRVAASILGTRYVTSTGLKATPDESHWDDFGKRARKGSSNASGVSWFTINACLSKIESTMSRYENKCITDNHRPSVPELQSVLLDCLGRKRRDNTGENNLENDIEIKKDPEFLDYFEEFTCETSLRNQWTRATHQKMAALKNHLQRFSTESLDFNYWNEDGFNKFIAYLIDEEQMKNSSVGNQISFLKWFLRWAAKKGYNQELTFQYFQPRLKSAAKRVVFLEWNELMKVYNFEVPANGTEVTLQHTDGSEYAKIVHDAAAIRKTRDIFCFCCFTSLRYSDANNLKISNVQGNTITITTVKTADTITIELNKYAQSILARYIKNVDRSGYIFPRITNQRMNIYVKDLCELCGINQPITQTYYRGSERIDETLPKFELIGTHTGRRTFICNALMLGIPAEIVMKWTGHSDYKAMKPYIDVANSAKAKAMNLFNQI